MACIGALRIEGVVLLEDSNKGAFAVLLSSRAAQKHCRYDYRDISFRCHVFLVWPFKTTKMFQYFYYDFCLIHRSIQLNHLLLHGNWLQEGDHTSFARGNYFSRMPTLVARRNPTNHGASNAPSLSPPVHQPPKPPLLSPRPTSSRSRGHASPALLCTRGVRYSRSRGLGRDRARASTRAHQGGVGAVRFSSGARVTPRAAFAHGGRNRGGGEGGLEGDSAG